MAKLTVIIPYYQREPGILRRALASVFAQTFTDFDVVIIDDQSPYPVDEELKSLARRRGIASVSSASRMPVRVVRATPVSTISERARNLRHSSIPTMSGRRIT